MRKHQSIPYGTFSMGEEHKELKRVYYNYGWKNDDKAPSLEFSAGKECRRYDLLRSGLPETFEPPDIDEGINAKQIVSMVEKTLWDNGTNSQRRFWKILMMRHVHGLSSDEIAQRMYVTRERIRQIEMKHEPFLRKLIRDKLLRENVII